MQIIQGGGRPIKAWIDGVPLEPGARKQLIETSYMPIVEGHIAAMADAHEGIGATVGSVIPTKGAIIPAAVGVDIGCGMIAARTPLSANDLGSLRALRDAIENTIPLGFAGYDKRIPSPPLAQDHWATMSDAFRQIAYKHPKMDIPDKAFTQLGTLGGGNHFIEVCLDESDTVWVMLHSGSRGIGNRIGQYFIELAREDMRVHQVNLPNRDLAYLKEGTEFFYDYRFALGWAQGYAFANRDVMIISVLNQVAKHAKRWQKNMPYEIIANCHHNYVEWEEHFGQGLWITRKGAVRARRGDIGIIPGSMGARSYIVEGLGNPESYHSCSHGAGRTMSRTEARKRFTLSDHEAATKGIECRKDAAVLDETPGAYKDIDAVMEAQRDLVRPLYVLRQIVCVKG